MKNYMIIKQGVRDLGEFQRVFDKLKPMREQHGLKDIGQYRSADEPDTVIVLLEVADISMARRYWHSKALSESRKQAGVVGPLTAGSDEVWLTNGTVRSSPETE
jgi:erythromycin esterase-like protein